MIKLADTLAPMSNDFYAVESKNVGIDIDGTSKSIQQAYEDGDLSGGGSSIQVDTMPIASEYPNEIVQYIGESGTYQNGYFYQSTSDEQNPPTYSWVQKNVQPNTNIVDTAIETTSTWSSKKISDSLVNIADKLEKKADVSDLANKQDFRIFNSLEEFNEKKGTSLTVVSGIDNMKDIANAMSNGEMLIITTKCELGSEVYFGLTKNTGWTKMFTFIKSNELCDVECRTTFPLTLKRVLNSDGVIGDWQELATTTQLSGSTVASANKIEPNYTSVSLTQVASTTTKYIKVADCPWDSTGTLQVSLSGNNLVDTLVINFGGGNGATPMLCGYYSGNSFGVYSVIIQKGSTWSSDYSIYVKVRQLKNCNVQVALLKSECTINVTESTTAPTNITEYPVNYGLFGDFTGNVTGNAKTANKIEPNYTKVELTAVTSNTIKYIKIADCNAYQAGTLQVFLRGDSLIDTLVINFGSGTALEPMLCGYYSGNSKAVYSVIAQKGSSWNQSYSIYVKVNQASNCNVNVALLKGDCTVNITESTTAPTDIYEWTVKYGLFGNIASPEIISLEQRVSALESKL